ncbi:hypothetical protein LCGC14_0388400 [marine sediment metagenome]|uniref:Uncharacterized protein n=1 Tax=marine sediment metagenome TaxID=412755 RepID=A0A0F9W983_9ZZZZ
MTELEVRFPTLHPSQQEVIDSALRFNHLRCGRRWGKTTLIVELCDPSLDGYPVGIWFPTYKDLSEVWHEVKKAYHQVISKKDEQLKQLRLISGGVIDFWSMENPDSGQGRKYKRAIIDEASKAPKLLEAWKNTIRPTLTDYRGDGWILSRPKGKNNDFYLIEEDYKQFDNWKFFHYTIYDNPYIDREEIEEWKFQEEGVVFRQEGLAEYVDANVSVFAFNFNKSHIGKTEWRADLETLLSFDFNREPLTCVIAQKPDFNKIHFIEDISVINVDIEEMCNQVMAKYPDALFRVTGDQTGENESALKKGLTYYRKIKELLTLTDGQVSLPGKNPLHRISRMETNMILAKCEVIYDKDNCKDSIWDLQNVEYDPEKLKIIKDSRQSKKQQADFLDCTRYMFSTFMRDELTYLGL